MVDVNTQNKTISVNVSSSGVSSNVNASGDYSYYYSEKAREWAISNRIVDGVDYSSKYYAGRANQSALNAQSFAQSAQNSYNNFQDSVDGALSTVNDTVQDAIEDINNAKTDIITDIEFVADGAKEEIEDLVDTGKDEIQELTNEIKDNVEDIINRVSISMFDTKVSDHILDGEEAIGWALQGTYVNKIDYPDFYDECIAQQTAGTSTEITLGLGASTVTMSVNANGHTFYNIADKATVDTYYAGTGIADFYGIDTENERVFLPREVVIVQGSFVTKLKYYCVGNTEVKQAISNVTEITTTENDTIPLFTGMYFDFKPNHPSWLKGGEQKNRAGLYETTYDTLVDCLNGTNPYELNVINISDMVAGVDYSEYWILDQDNMVFQTPTAISNKALSGAVMGNGMTLGMTDGTKYAGLMGEKPTGASASYAVPFTSSYGATVGTNPGRSGSFTNSIAYGVTTDPTKSGIVAEQSTAQLYFKVANAVQNLELLNVGEVMEAVNSVVPDNSSLIAGYAMPSNRYIDLTLGASGSTYTAPADGWFYFNKVSNGNNQYGFLGTAYYGVIENCPISDNRTHLLLPVKKDTVIKVEYSVGGTTFAFRFIYAQGSESEAL